MPNKQFENLLRNLEGRMAGILAKFGSSDFHRQSIYNAKRKLVARALGATLIIALVALVANQQATSTADTKAHDSAKQVQLDVVPNTSNANSQSVTDFTNPDVSNTTNNVGAGSASNNSSSSVSVTVNGQSVEVPQNGTTQQTITTPDGGTASVNISNNSDVNGTSFSSSVSSTSQNSFSSSVNSSTVINQSSGQSP